MFGCFFSHLYSACYLFLHCNFGSVIMLNCGLKSYLDDFAVPLNSHRRLLMWQQCTNNESAFVDRTAQQTRCTMTLDWRSTWLMRMMKFRSLLGSMRMVVILAVLRRIFRLVLRWSLSQQPTRMSFPTIRRLSCRFVYVVCKQLLCFMCKVVHN